MSARVLLLENVHDTAVEILEGAGLRVERVATGLREDELIARLAGVQMLGIRSKTQVTANVLKSAKDLISVGCFCIGTNQVDLRAAAMQGIPVFNAPFSNTRSVAEMILAEIVILARQIGDRSREVHEGKWRKVSRGCFEVRGKTLGIIGYGHIGTQVGILAEAFGMRVLYFDVAQKLPLGNSRPIGTLEEVLAESDFVTLHVPETPLTKNLMGAKEISRMRPGSYLLNASRGQVVDLAALSEALKSGHLSGAAVDVYPEEPEGNSDAFGTELRGLPNVLLTPHIGGSTEEAQASIGKEVGLSLERFIREGTTTSSVNFPQVEMPLAKGSHRIINVHRNVPGVLRDINRIVSDSQANIKAQMLSTDSEIGYLVMDMEQAVAEQVSVEIGALKTNIRTRYLA